jgi:D-alanyl-D-alanine carboxypeptidase
MTQDMLEELATTLKAQPWLENATITTVSADGWFSNAYFEGVNTLVRMDIDSRRWYFSCSPDDDNDFFWEVYLNYRTATYETWAENINYIGEMAPDTGAWDVDAAVTFIKELHDRLDQGDLFPQVLVLGMESECISGPDAQHACYANGNECHCPCVHCDCDAI